MTQTPAVPLDASTVCLVTDGQDGVEVLMVRRSLTASFVGGFYVFPGGKVDPADSSELAATAIPDVSEDMLPWVGAAIRETAEEAGVLLSADDRPEIAAAASSLTSEEFYRRVVESQTTLVGSNLAYFANWITPESEPKRFDTKFFIASLDRRREGSADGKEVTDVCWVRPRDALAKAKAREWGVIFPTWKTLELLEAFASAGEAVSHARSIDVKSRQPHVVRADDGSIRIVLPGEPEWTLEAT